MQERGKFRIGTSNTVVPGNKSSFPPPFQQSSRLHYYSSIFNTVEVNSCFYKTPMLSTYEKWSLDVPGDFQFSLKLSKLVTHAKELQIDLSCMDHFIRSAGGIGNKKGCLLIQFPGKISLDFFDKVEQILDELQGYDPDNHWRKAAEFRHPSWHTGETKELLNEFDAAMVLHDHPKARISELFNKATFVYLRFHGPKGDYRGAYSNDLLKTWAIRISEWLDEGKDVYAYFNNTIGSAFENAISLQKLVENPHGR